MVNGVLKEPLRLNVVNVVGGGEGEEWATLELEANGTCKNGQSPDPNRYHTGADASRRHGLSTALCLDHAL